MTDIPLFGTLSSLRSGIRLSQFLSVGILGYVVDQLVITGLVGVFAVSVIYAKPVSAEAAIIVMFIVNERWTFAKWGRTGPRAIATRFLKSNAVRVGGVLIAYIVLVILHNGYNVHYLLANTIGIGIGFVANYIAETLFTWRVGINP